MNRLPTRAALIAFALLLPLTVSIIADESAEAKRKTQSNLVSTPSVVLTVDYGDGAQKRFPNVPWEKGMTVFDTLDWATSHPHGIKLKHKGQGALAMVSQIDDLKNSGGNGKNWIFHVNDKVADRSCGAYRVDVGDEIRWQFEVYR